MLVLWCDSTPDTKHCNGHLSWRERENFIVFNLFKILMKSSLLVPIKYINISSLQQPLYMDRFTSCTQTRVWFMKELITKSFKNHQILKWFIIFIYLFLNTSIYIPGKYISMVIIWIISYIILSTGKMVPKQVFSENWELQTSKVFFFQAFMGCFFFLI